MKTFSLCALSGLLGLAATTPLPSSQGTDQDASFISRPFLHRPARPAKPQAFKPSTNFIGNDYTFVGRPSLAEGPFSGKAAVGNDFDNALAPAVVPDAPSPRLQGSDPYAAGPYLPVSNVNDNHQLNGVQVGRSTAGDEPNTLVKRDVGAFPYVVAQSNGRIGGSGSRRGRATSYAYADVNEQRPTACGLSGFDPVTAPLVALSSKLMGPLAFNNPHCRLPVTLSYKGRTVRAYVGDKCPYCARNNMVVSPAVMQALNPGGRDREPLFGMTWQLGSQRVNPTDYTLDVEGSYPENSAAGDQPVNQGVAPGNNQLGPGLPNTDELDPGQPDLNQNRPSPSPPDPISPNLAPSPGTTNQGATNQGTTNQGTTNQGTTNQGATNQGATNQGATNQGATNQGATTPARTNQQGLGKCANPNGRFEYGCATPEQVKQQQQQSTQPQIQMQPQPDLPIDSPTNLNPGRPSVQFPGGADLEILQDPSPQPSPGANQGGNPQSATPQRPTTGGQPTGNQQSSTSGGNTANVRPVVLDVPLNRNQFGSA